MRGVVKKYSAPLLGSLGGSWPILTPEESGDQECFGKEWKEEEGLGVGKWGEGIVLLWPDTPSPSGLAGRWQVCLGKPEAGQGFGSPLQPPGWSFQQRIERGMNVIVSEFCFLLYFFCIIQYFHETIPHCLLLSEEMTNVVDIFKQQ